jgi:cytochrome c5
MATQLMIISKWPESKMRRAYLRELITGLILTGICGSAFVGQVSAAEGNPEAAKGINPIPATADSLAAGKKNYEKFCVPCHGVQGKGGIRDGKRSHR